MRLVAHPADCPYEAALDRNPANYAPPADQLHRARRRGLSAAHRLDPRRHARHVCGVLARARRLAAALAGRGVGPGDTVAVMLPNTPPMLEAHFGVPMAGAVLNSINYRLEPATIAYILEHGAAKVLLTDTEFAPTIATLEQVSERPLVIDAVDRQFRGDGERLGEFTYEAFLTEGEGSLALYPADEWQAIGLNYTSGTTGQPSAWWSTIAEPTSRRSARRSPTRWGCTRPSCGPCRRSTRQWLLDVHLGGDAPGRHPRLPAPGRARPGLRGDRGAQGDAPVRRAHRHEHDRQRSRGGAPAVRPPVQAMTGGAAPPAAVLQRLADQGIHVIHLYGLTERYGPDGVRLAGGVGRAVGRRAGADAGAPGRALPDARGGPGDRPGDHAPWRAMARRSARSCCAATR